MATAPTPGRNSGRRTSASFWRGRTRSHVVGGHVVHGDEPVAVEFFEQPRVDALRDAGAAHEPVLADQHRRVRSEQVDLHVVEVEPASTFRRAAIVANVMVERALPALLELAARNEHHVGVLEPGHVATEVAAIPRQFHPVDDRQDRRFVGLRARGGECQSDEEAHSWNWPAMTVRQWPPRITRSPARRQWRMPLRSLAWSAVNSSRPRRFAQKGTSAAWAEPVTGSSSMP